MKAAKFLYGLLGIFLAVLIYWYIIRLIGRRVEAFGAQEQLASRNTEVAPTEKKSPEQLKYLFKNDNLPQYVLDSSRIERPYLTDPINSLDDYEYNLVFQNEGSRELTQEKRNILTSAYPMDWSGLPPSAAAFQAGQTDMRPAVPYMTDSYKAIEDASLPDMEKMDEEEKKILATYAPKKANDLTTYDIEDAKELIYKIYDKRDEIPEIVEKPNNVFEIVGVQPKHPKIVYEDEPEAVQTQLEIPQAASDIAAGLDPFYEPRNSTRISRSDYTKWTPGLERMFAPTYEKREWY